MIWDVYDQNGQRKYLTEHEINHFIKASIRVDTDVHAFCCMLAFTGCRISEALSMTRESIDFNSQHIVIRCLKKRGKIIYRAIPVPEKFLRILERWIGKSPASGERLWPWSRMTGYRRVRDVMELAQIRGGHATPKGLRHGFGIRAIQSGVPLTLVQRWLGHADIKTTAIYTGAVGPEEREIAARMWRQPTGVNQIGTKTKSKHAGNRAPTAAVLDYPPRSPARPFNVVETVSASDSLLLDGLSSMIRRVPDAANGLETHQLPACALIHFWINCIYKYSYIPTRYRHSFMSPAITGQGCESSVTTI
jgi:Phage integrase family